MSLINDAFIKVLGHTDPFKRVDRFKNAYPEFWCQAVEQTPFGRGNRTTFCVRPGFESEFRLLAEEYARGGCWAWRCGGGSLVSSIVF
jgi:hypothetical protein